MFGLDLLIWLVIVVLIVGVLLWGVRYSGLVPEPLYRILVVVAVVIVLILVVNKLGLIT